MPEIAPPSWPGSSRDPGIRDPWVYVPPVPGDHVSSWHEPPGLGGYIFLDFPCLPFHTLPFPSAHHPSLPFRSVPLSPLPFPSRPFPSLPPPSLPFFPPSRPPARPIAWQDKMKSTRPERGLRRRVILDLTDSEIPKVRFAQNGMRLWCAALVERTGGGASTGGCQQGRCQHGGVWVARDSSA